MLEIRNLRVAYGALTIVDGLSFRARENGWLMIVGPNGAGKSTIISAVSQSAPYTGEALVDGRDLRRMRHAERARTLGVLTQNHAVGYAFSVGEIVELGRYAYSRGRLNAEDRRRIDEALEMTGLADRRRQSALTLSGGELQRAFLAQAFAQDPRILLLDEPTNHLDLVYQKQIFSLIDAWRRAPGRAVVSVMHDLGVARRYGTEALL
ncbi:MAG: ABC transporter ATP-binding protein, partial [Clostridia bacterium]|nr:ABC transporter ATP-binding protein [Clostridia bacterium]